MDDSSTEKIRTDGKPPAIPDTIPSLRQPEPPPDMFDPPTRPNSLGRIGHYEIYELLGRGGFGFVVRAHDDVLQRHVAIKVLAPIYASVPASLQRFLREARATAAIRHENVVQIHAIHDSPVPHLVMEYIPGQTLQQWIDRGPLPVEQVVQIGIQIAQGLAAAHDQGLIHRDVKPANILMEQGSTIRVKITDFGLARSAHDVSLSGSGFVAGTPLYMAPEQTTGETLDQRADLFSLGSVLYTMLTGKPPFQAATPMAVMRLVCDKEPRPLRDVRPDVPEGIAAIIARMHEKDPAKRFNTAHEVAEALARAGHVAPSQTTTATATNHWLKLLVAVGGAVFATLAVLVGLHQFKQSPAPATPPVVVSPTPNTPPDPTATKVNQRTLAHELRSLDREWSKPINLGPNINTAQRELTPTLTRDECTMIFYRDSRFYMAQRASREEPFGPAEPMPEAINNLPRESPTLSGDGLVFVFASYRGRKMASSLWMSQRASIHEPFGEPSELPAPVKSSGWEIAPVLSDDGLTLLTTSMRPPSLSKAKILMFTRKNRTEPFGNMVELPPNINSSTHSIADWLSPDGTVLLITQTIEKRSELRFLVRTSVNEPFGQAQTLDGFFDQNGIARPWLSPDGQRIYFHSRDIAGGQGNLDLWMCQRVPKKATP